MNDDLVSYFMHITAPSSCIDQNSTSFNSLQQQIKQPLESLNSNLNGMSFIINQLNSHLLSMYKSDVSFSTADLQSALNCINQIYNSFKPLNQIAKNKQTNDSKTLGELQDLYGQFIKYTIKCIKNLVLPDDLYMQIYASLTPVLCLYLKKISGENIDISLSDFNILIRLNEESVEAVLHFLSENKFETLIEKLISQFCSDGNKRQSQVLFQTIVDSLESIKQLLIPRPQKSGKYKAAINLIEELKYNMTSYCENEISKSTSSIFILISHIESILKSLRLGYLSKESLKSLIKYISINECQINVDPIEQIPKKLINNVLCLYLQEVQSLHKNKLVDDSFAENVDNILKSKADYHEFLETVPNYYETSVINEMSRSFSHFDILTTTQLKNFDDCCNMYIEFSREADDFHKGSKLHYDLMKNLIIAESEVIFTTCLKNDEDGDQIHIEKVDPILPLTDDIISIMNNLTIQKQTKIILTFLTHALKIIQLAFTSIKDQDEIKNIKDFLALHIPSFDSIDIILGIKQKIGDLIGIIKLYNVFKNEQYNPQTADEIFDHREMKENFEITVIQKQRQIPEMILRALDVILPYKDFPSKYTQLTEAIGGSVPNDFSNFVFDQDLINISNCLLSMICSLRGKFELNGDFFLDWLKIIFSMFYDDEYPIPKFSEIIPFFNFSFIFSRTILTFNITRIMINQQLQSSTSKTKTKESEIESKMIDSVESLRLYVFSVLKNLDIDICTLYFKINDIKEKAKKYLDLIYYRRIKDQMDYIVINMIVLSEINNLSSLLSKKYPEEIFDFRPISYINYALSIYQLISSISESKYLTENFLTKLDSLRSNADIVFDVVKKSKFFSPDLNETLSDLIVPFISEIHQLIRSFDITSLVDVTYEFVYSILDFYNSKESADSITPETLVSILQLNFISETISQKSSIFHNTNSIASILFTLFNIKQQPPQLRDLFEKLRETIITSFINFNLFEIVNFIQHIFIERFGFIKVYQTENEFDLVSRDDYELDNLSNMNKYGQISEIIPQTIDDMCELRSYAQRVIQDRGLISSSSNPNSSEFVTECQNLFEEIEKVISPFIESNEQLSSLKDENQKLLDDCRLEEKKWISKTKEAEKIFVKTRKNCHKVRSRIESAILEEEKLKISIEQKRKQLIELHSQIEKKEHEMAVRNERTPPEMKQKQKLEFIDTIHSLRELVGPTTSDPDEVNKLTQKLAEMNSENEKLKKEIEKIDSRHSTTQEDEIELLMMTDDSTFLNPLNQENVEEENVSLEKQISEIEASNDRIRKKLKKIEALNLNSTSSSSSSNSPLSPSSSSSSLLQNQHQSLKPIMPTIGKAAKQLQGEFLNSFISGSDMALADFLHSSRPYSFNGAGVVDYESFMAFRNSTLDCVNELMLKRQSLIEERDGMKKDEKSSQSSLNEKDDNNNNNAND